MGNIKNPVMAAAAIGAACVIAAGVAVPARAGTTSGVRYLQEFVGAGFAAPGPGGEATGCSMVLLSAAASDGSPAYVSGMLENSTSDVCTGWLEHSVNGGAWSDVSPQATLPTTAQGLVNYPWAKTANYYAGPGTSVRPCVLTPATTMFPAEAVCSSSSVTLPGSTAAPADDGTSVFYAHNDQTANVSAGSLRCSATLSSSDTLSKTASSAASLLLSGTDSCTGWVETSADGGTTWEQATPANSLTLSNPRTEWAFSPAVADGTGELSRACAQLGTQPKACTAAW